MAVSGASPEPPDRFVPTAELVGMVQSLESQLHDRIRLLEARAVQVDRELMRLDEAEAGVGRLVIDGQGSAEEARANARNQIKVILADARRRADQIRADTELNANRLIAAMSHASADRPIDVLG